MYSVMLIVLSRLPSVLNLLANALYPQLTLVFLDDLNHPHVPALASDDLPEGM